MMIMTILENFGHFIFKAHVEHFLILLYFVSLLLSKARFISEQFIYYLRALSNQTVPYQALTKIMKRETTKIEK